jgi:hypothetical protein
MSTRGTVIKLGIVATILALCTVLLVVVFGQLRFEPAVWRSARSRR